MKSCGQDFSCWSIRADRALGSLIFRSYNFQVPWLSWMPIVTCPWCMVR